jgi:DNA-binding PadR family transcriptional regulator
MLSEAPMTGYEIKKRVDTSLRFFTQAGYGTLYPTLHCLLQDGAVRMEEDVQPHRPARKVYEITDLGRQELDIWLREPGNGHERREFLLRLFIGHARSANHLCALLQQRRQAIQAELQAL